MTKEIKKATESYLSEPPKWAKWVRNIGIVAGAIGGTIATSGLAFPALLVAAAPYLVLIGNASAVIAQGFKKQ